MTLTEDITTINNGTDTPARDYVKFLDGYRTIGDGYTENPFAHYENASASDIESEYFLQWVFPNKLHRVALRTAAGYRLVYKQAEDVWNNNIGIHIEEDKKKADSINRQLVPYLKSRKWFREMQKLTAYYIEQGEAILMLYFNDQGNVDNYSNPVKKGKEILGVEAFNVIDYWIPAYDKKGEPARYEITVKTGDSFNSLLRVEVHPSRVIRLTDQNIEFRWRGYSDLASVYDAINVLSSILKATGEAAFRWSTGHPVIFTKDLFTETDLEKLKDAIGDFTRRSWHMIPSEYVDRIDLMGQAGSMLNLKALSDICVDHIVIGSGYPRAIFLGEAAGVMGSEVEERSYFALLDRRHTQLEWFVEEYFSRDINVQKLIGDEEHTLDWGIREVLNKMDQAELRQKQISNALALMQICTIDECREVAGYEPIGEEEGGDLILPIFEAELQILALELQAQMAEQQAKMKENSESTTAKEQGASTTKKSQTGHSLDKKGKGKMKDAFDEILRKKSISEICREWNIHDSTFRKIYQKIKKQRL
jgi:hypothetical protein